MTRRSAIHAISNALELNLTDTAELVDEYALDADSGEVDDGRVSQIINDWRQIMNSKPEDDHTKEQPMIQRPVEPSTLTAHAHDLYVSVIAIFAGLAVGTVIGAMMAGGR